MKTTTRNILIALLLFALLAICASSLLSGHHIVINGDELDGMSSIGVVIAGIVITAIASLFALLCTGFILAGISAFFLLIFVIVIAAVVCAMLPFALPFLILAAVILLLQHKKSKPVSTAQQ